MVATITGPNNDSEFLIATYAFEDLPLTRTDTSQPSVPFLVWKQPVDASSGV
jgi:hypothetical protein